MPSRKLLIVALGATTILAVAAQALAAAKPPEPVSADGGNAKLIFKKRGYSLQACDTEKDGYGVVAYIYTKGRRQAAFQAADLNGADNGCEATRINEPLGRDIVLRVVVKDHNNSEKQGKNHLKDDQSRRLRLV